MYLLLFRCPGGGIGRRSRLKICFLREYGFDPRPGYHLFISASPLQKASNCSKNFIFPQLLFLFALPFLQSKKMAMLTLLRVAVARLRHIVGLRPPCRSPSRIPSFSPYRHCKKQATARKLLFLQLLFLFAAVFCKALFPIWVGNQ